MLLTCSSENSILMRIQLKNTKGITTLITRLDRKYNICDS